MRLDEGMGAGIISHGFERGARGMGILDWFGRKDEPIEPWRRLAPAGGAEDSRADATEMLEANPEHDEPDDVDGLLIEFDYVDSQGVCTTRGVLCHQVFWNEGGIYVRGICTMREAMRTFRVDRMEAVRELRSGFAVDDPIEFFEGLAVYDEDAFERRKKTEISPRVDKFSAHQEERAWRRARESEARDAVLPGLKILAYLSLLDGAKNEDEARLEAAYAAERLADIGFEGDSDLVAAMLFLARGLTPTRRSYVQAVGKISRDDDHLATVGRYALELARVDGVIDPAERDALNLLLVTARKKRA